jgi:hypothetical protein
LGFGGKGAENTPGAAVFCHNYRDLFGLSSVLGDSLALLTHFSSYDLGDATQPTTAAIDK